MPRVASGGDDRERQTGLAEPLERERHQRRADALTLGQRVDRDHLDLARPLLLVDPQGDEPGRVPVPLGDPHRRGVVPADGLDVTSLRCQPVRIERPVDLVAKGRAERLEHRRPGAERQRDHIADVLRRKRADARRHRRRRRCPCLGGGAHEMDRVWRLALVHGSPKDRRRDRR